MIKNITNLIILIVVILFTSGAVKAEEKSFMPAAEKKVRLSWEEVKGVTSYRILIKDSSGKVIVRESSSVNSVVVDVAPGNYQLRIGSINKFNKVWSWSDWADLTIEETPLTAYDEAGKETGKKPQDAEGLESESTGRKDLKQAAGEGKDTDQEVTDVREALPGTGKDSESKTSGISISVSIEGNYLLPMGLFKDITSSGMGGLLYIEKPGLFVNNFTAGLGTGYWQIRGDDINKSYIIPGLVTAGYNINFLIFTMTPRISGGMSYNYIEYSYISHGEEIVKNISAVEPIVLGGINLYFNIGSFSFYLGADYGSIIESENRFPFALFGAGLSFRF